MTTTSEHLFEKYGPLMQMDCLAKVLGRSTAGLRVTLCRTTDFSRELNRAKIKRGRRVYFKTEAIIAFINADESNTIYRDPLETER